MANTPGEPPSAEDVCPRSVRIKIEEISNKYLSQLRDFAVIPSCSTSFECRQACFEAARFVQQKLEALGAEVDSVAAGYQELSDGEKFDLPPILLAKWKHYSPSRPTVLVYLNYDIRDVICTSANSYLSCLSLSMTSSTRSFAGSPSNTSSDSVQDRKPNGVLDHEASSSWSHSKISAPNKAVNSSTDRDVTQDKLLSQFRLPFSADNAGVIHGYGLAHGKASLIAWLGILEAYELANLQIPVNLKFIIEGMGYSNSECVNDVIQREISRGGFLADVDYIIVNGGQWVAPKTPSVITGLRGLLKFEMQIIGGSKNLDAGEFGGCVAEPMTDLIQLLALLQSRGHDQVDLESFGIAKDDKGAVTSKERSPEHAVDITLASLKSAAGNVSSFIGGEDVRAIHANRASRAVISIHGIEGAPFGRGVNTIIPASVNGKFSIRFPAEYDADNVALKMRSALESHFAKLQSSNELFITHEGSNGWEADTSSTLLEAVVSASLAIFGKFPAQFHSGESIPVVNVFEKLLQKDVMVLPLSGSVMNADVTSADDDPVYRDDFTNAMLMISGVLSQVTHLHGANSSRDGKSAAVTSAGSGALAKIRDIWRALG